MGDSKAASGDYVEVTGIVEAEVVSEHEAAAETSEPGTVFQGTEPDESDSAGTGSSGAKSDTVFQGGKIKTQPDAAKPGPKPDTVFQG
jgi:hypothetical protein